MSINGYSDKLIAIDDEMVALGRPIPPAVAWLSGGQPGGKQEFNARTKAWHEAVEAWEEANPESAIRWHELRHQYVVEEQAELKKRYSEEAWNYVTLEHLGVPKSNVDMIQRNLDDNGSMKAAREWMLSPDLWCLVLIGGTGCGKSTAAAWAAHQSLMRNFGVQWVDCVKQCEAPMYGVGAEHRRWQCRSSHTLVLDDLGSGRRERESQVWLAWLDDVIGSRANEKKRTIITSNRSMDELKAWLGDRLYDRIRIGSVYSTKEKSFRGRST